MLDPGILSFGLQKDQPSPDFAIQTLMQPIVLEVGTGKKSTRQVNKYQKEKRYGLLLNATSDALQATSGSLSLPLSWWLLL